MATNMAPIKFTAEVSTKVIKKVNSIEDRARRIHTLKETQEKEYLFLDFDLQGMFDIFLM